MLQVDHATGRPSLDWGIDRGRTLLEIAWSSVEQSTPIQKNTSACSTSSTIIVERSTIAKCGIPHHYRDLTHSILSLGTL